MNRAAGVAVAVGLTLWWLLALRLGPLLLPTPPAVVAALAAEPGRLAAATWTTASAALSGLFAAVVAGLAVATLTWRFPRLRQAVVPYAVLIQVIPIVAIAPLLLVWLGYGSGVARATAFIASFYPVYAAAGTGLVAPTEDLVDLLRLYGARPRQELVHLRLPAALPSLFAGLRTAAGLAVIGAIVGEFVGSNGQPPSLGWLVVYGARTADTARCFAAIAAASLLALSLNLAIGVVERRAIGSWYGTAR